MWKRIWGASLADQAQQEALNASLLKHWITAGLFLDRLLGNYACGLVALEAYYGTKSGEVTAEYVSYRLEGFVSDDTARRRLNAMLDAGTMSRRKDGRTIYFKLLPDVAEAAIAFMRGDPVLLPQVAVK
jgi:hypothetical protein